MKKFSIYDVLSFESLSLAKAFA